MHSVKSQSIKGDNMEASVQSIRQKLKKEGLHSVEQKLLRGAYGRKKKGIVENWVAYQKAKPRRIGSKKKEVVT
jgi:hypothetical protein